MSSQQRQPREGEMADIAVIGMGCRFPGDAKSPQEFYDMLITGRTGWSEIPKDRFNIDAYWHPSYDRKGTIVSRGGHFLSEDVGFFDAPFFSMTQAEANSMDPQHRMLLEITYETLESAGIPMASLVGSDTSCYVGGFTKEYDTVCATDLNDTLLYTTTGNGLTMMSNRLSWFYDMRGPSLTLDTACSSSLVALSLAVQQIRNSKSQNRQSLVAGSNLVLVPDQMTTMNPLHFLSPDSQCYSFDDRANGYVRGEGVGVLLLKHIDDAIRDGDCIRGVIRNVVCNQDGKTPGITLPSSEAQLSLIRQTYQSANLNLDETGYFEAHGTGTAAGDPLEVSAIAAAFQREKEGRSPLYIGSVKPNIGHLEAGAGMAGLIKSILAVESGIIPGNILFENANPRLGLEARNLKVVQGPTPWATSGVRRASINSFGYGGTNGHCVIDDAENYLAARGLKGNTVRNALPKSSAPRRRPLNRMDSAYVSEASRSSGDESDDQKSKPNQTLFVVSAPDQAALGRIVEGHTEYLKSRTDLEPAAAQELAERLAYTYSNRRSTFQWRKTVVAQSTMDLISRLSGSDGQAAATRATNNPSVLFLFTGQGAQWLGMGRELLRHEVFRQSVQAADAHLRSLGAAWSALQLIAAENVELDVATPSVAQPLCTVLQVALVDLLRHWNIAPRAVVGHSSGEIGAAYAAGALSPEQSWSIAYHRGRLAEELPGRNPGLAGGMMAVGLSREATEEYFAKLGPLSEGEVLGVACCNSPESSTVSGDVALLEKLEALLKEAGVFARRLQVKTAYHSQHMQLLADDYRQSIADVAVPSTASSGVTMYSSVTGAAISPEQLTADYWVKNMVSPVLFDGAVQSALRPAGKRRAGRGNAVNFILELGPAAALRGPVRQILQDAAKTSTASKNNANIPYDSVLQRKEDAQRSALVAAGALWSAGAPVIVARVNSRQANVNPLAPVVDLPKYPWNHETRYWKESSLSKSLRFRHAPRTDLLGEPIREFTWAEPTWKNYIYVSEQPWIADHVVRGSDVFPAAAMICSAIEGVKQCAVPGKTLKSFDLRNVAVPRAMVIPASDPGIEVFTRLRPQRRGKKGVSNWYDFSFESLELSNGPERRYTEHCSGQISIVYEDDSSTSAREYQAATLADKAVYEHAGAVATRTVTSQEHYDATARIGIIYGPLFQGLKTIQAGPGYATFEIELADTKSVMPAEFEYPFVIHPTFLDAAIQSAYQGLTHDRHDGEDDTVVPTEFKFMRVSANMPTTSGTRLSGFCKSDWISGKDCTATIKMAENEWSETLLELSDCIFMGLADSTQRAGSEYVERRLAAKNVWKPALSLVDTSGSAIQQLIGKDVEGKTVIGDSKAVCTHASFIYIKRAMEALTPEIEANLTGHWVPFTQWIHQRYEDGKAGRLFGQAASSDDWMNMSKEAEEAFLQRAVKAYPDDVKLLMAVGNELYDIITEVQQPLTIMIVDDMLSRFYSDTMTLAPGLNMFRDLFDHLGHENPGMKVLEIGAGTGSVTIPVMKALGFEDGRTPRFGSYTFTDISAGWFSKAQEFLKPWENYVEYKKLDIESDPFEQGFEPESFDVISASNVLHATKRMDVTLSNCFKLLKPGGKMVIGELTACPDHSALIFGTLPGWWLSEDGRTGGPMMTQQEWNKILLDSGFTGLDYAVAVEDNEDIKILSTMVSTKPKVSAQPALIKVFILKPYVPSEMGSAIVSALEQKLKANGVTATSVGLEEAVVLANSDELAAKDTAVVSLLEAETPVFSSPSRDAFEQVRTILLKSNLLYWCSCTNDEQGVCPPNTCAVSGILRTARSENPTLRTFDVRLQARPIGELSVTASRVWTTLSALWVAEDGITYESELSEAHGYVTVPRIMDHEPLNKTIRNIGKTPEPEPQLIKQVGRPLKLQGKKNTRIENLFFAADEEATAALPDDFVEIEAQAHGINHSDVGLASGKEPGLVFGLDAAGTISCVGSAVTKFAVGDKVALVTPDAFRTHIRVSEQVPQLIPSTMSLEEAAATPFVFITAYQGAIESAQLSKGEKVLISQATSSLGQALVAISKHVGADVYVTASSEEKRKVLEEQFGFPSDRVLDSSSSVFGQSVRRIGGIDVILNLLGGEEMAGLCAGLTPLGRFINFNLEDVKADVPLRLGSLGRNVTFKSVDMKFILENAPQVASNLVAKVFSLFNNGMVPISKPTVYNYTDLDEAFLAAQKPETVGKVVLQLNESSKVNAVPYDQHPLELSADATYLISGGLGGVGRALACYMADNGARNIALLSRSTELTDKAAETIKYLENLSVHVKVIGCDITSPENVEAAVANILSDMPPIRGVVQAAMVLEDGLYENLTYKQWMASIRPKIDGTWNLHEVLPKDLDFFIMLSSIAGIIGNPGQPNYASGNSWQDALCHYRRSQGLKATTMDLGGIGSFGWLDENKAGSAFADIMSNLMIQPPELLTMFKSAVTGYSSNDSQCPTQLIMGIGCGGASDAHVAAGGREPYFWLDAQSRFRYLRQLDLSTTAVGRSASAAADIKSLLAAATNMPEAGAIVEGALTAKIAKSLMMAPEDIDTSLPLSSYGVDSLVAAELRNWCTKDVQATMSVFELLDAKPINQLGVDIARKSTLVPETVNRG